MRHIRFTLIVILAGIPRVTSAVSGDTLETSVPESVITVRDSATVALRSMERFRDRFLTAAMNGDRTALATVETARTKALTVLDRALSVPAVVEELPWPDRRALLGLALHEHNIEWSRTLWESYEAELGLLSGPGRGPNAFVLGLTADRLRSVTTPDDSASVASLIAFSRRAYGIAVEENFLLRDEAMYRLWQSADAEEDTALASSWADSLALRHPRSVRTPQIRLTRARAKQGQGEPAEALEEARLALPTHNSAELRWVMVMAALDLGFSREAARDLEHLIGSFGTHPLAGAALDKREALGRKDPGLALDTENWIRLVTHLLPNSESGTLDTLVAMSHNRTLSTELREQAGLEVVRFLYRAKQYSKAEGLLVQLRKSQVEETAEEADLHLGRIYRNTGRRGPMKRHYRAVIRRDGTQASLAFWELGRELESLARWSEAEAVYTEFMDRFEVTSRYRDVLFRRGFCRIRRNKPKAAAEDFQEAFRISRSGAQEEQAAFWLARTLRSLGEEKKALTAAKAGASTPEPVGGYGVLIREGFLSASDQISFTESHRYPEDGILAQVDPSEWPSRVQHHFQRGLRFAELGEVDVARMEWRRAETLGRRIPSLIQSLALVAAAFNVYPEGVGWARRAGESLSLGHPLQMGFKRLSYPPAFYGDVFHNSVKHDLDPAAIWALMRQESLYDRLAVSRVGALGLMQIMPYTLDGINRTAGKPLQPPEVLFRPDVNIALGIEFFSDRLEEFDQNLLPTLASYNAGESKTWEWLGRAGGDTEEVFLECIGYPETYNYARRILWLNWVYNAYYGPATGVRGELR